ncbi:hypothetical protein HMPREF1640_11355 [Prevotella sp. S7-1-8]|nr:hypothetical protein HMPREF1640_11355 [Prevotella sp. S7-1-8]
MRAREEMGGVGVAVVVSCERNIDNNLDKHPRVFRLFSKNISMVMNTPQNGVSRKWLMVRRLCAVGCKTPCHHLLLALPLILKRVEIDA